MADAVTTNVIFNGQKRYVAQFINASDATGESAVVKVDISTLTGTLGAAPTDVAIEEVQWNMQGFTNVDLLFDATTDDVAVSLSGHGYKDFREYGGLVNPKSTGWTGDIVLTTDGAAAGATYDIILSVRLRN